MSVSMVNAFIFTTDTAHSNDRFHFFLFSRESHALILMLFIEAPLLQSSSGSFHESDHLDLATEWMQPTLPCRLVINKLECATQRVLRGGRVWGSVGNILDYAIYLILTGSVNQFQQGDRFRLIKIKGHFIIALAKFLYPSSIVAHRGACVLNINNHECIDFLLSDEEEANKPKKKKKKNGVGLQSE